MTPKLSASIIEAQTGMSEFGAMLFATAYACRDKSAFTLDRVLTAKVRAWADDQSASEIERIGKVDIPPAEPFTSSERSAA